MNSPAALLARLEAIGATLAQTPGALALLALGSVGLETERLDDFSDLDFFVTVAPGFKQQFIGDLAWLEVVHPVAFHFQNTVDGHKLLFADGIFCEFAVFEEAELAHIPYAPGRFVWKHPDADERIRLPSYTPPPQELQTTGWQLGEALSNLYVGLSRYRRGEKLSAMHFIQYYAVDRVIELSLQLTPATAGHADQFAPQRRYEQRYPQFAALLPQFMQGYEHSRESALAILDFLKEHFVVNQAMEQVIRDLCSP